MLRWSGHFNGRMHIPKQPHATLRWSFDIGTHTHTPLWESNTDFENCLKLSLRWFLSLMKKAHPSCGTPLSGSFNETTHACTRHVFAASDKSDPTPPSRATQTAVDVGPARWPLPSLPPRCPRPASLPARLGLAKTGKWDVGLGRRFEPWADRARPDLGRKRVPYTPKARRRLVGSARSSAELATVKCESWNKLVIFVHQAALGRKGS